ncbi:hypothetical protein [Glaciihabitans sp. dw_435]|uniref:hypothetical protein n=1 Tax=Glaciihabitans sp. dw_435 TaxID=2720081 RepID=UPI001BD2BD49|nr:hypothetical protein [Glaciihabitans sp. dw_435]
MSVDTSPIDPLSLIPAPSVGRTVHYQSYGTPGHEYLSQARAAIITEVHLSTTPNDEDWLDRRQYAEEYWSNYHNEMTTKEDVPEYIVNVSLCVLNPTGMFFDENVPFSVEPKPGHWSWPPRV